MKFSNFKPTVYVPDGKSVANGTSIPEVKPSKPKLSEQGLYFFSLINFAPQETGAAAMQPIDTSALVSILRNISREPRICKFSIVAFNMNEQRVVYRRDDMDQIDFPELGKALSSLKLGIVDYSKLAQPHSAF